MIGRNSAGTFTPYSARSHHAASLMKGFQTKHKGDEQDHSPPGSLNARVPLLAR